jgi:hypothetical protein
MSFTSDDYAYNKLLTKIGITGSGSKATLLKVLIPLSVCWLPLAVITIFSRTFWTGDSSTSFISNFDTQVRLLISMPVLILAERRIITRLGLILDQFVNSGIIRTEDRSTFREIIGRKTRFLNSIWTDLAILAFSYSHTLLMGFVEDPAGGIITWTTLSHGGETGLSLAGWWSLIVSRPLVLFLFYRWIMRIFVWALLLRKISKLNLNIYTVHPDLSGGLGFLGYSIRYFAPVALAISAAVAGRMIDAILIGGAHVSELRIYALLYFVVITLLFAFPLVSFTPVLINARDNDMFENNDFANGLFRELRKKTSKDYDKVSAEDLTLPDYSATTDLSSVINNTLKMRFVPFGLRDLIPLWLMTALPFIFVVLVEVPFFELVKKMLNLLV